MRTRFAAVVAAAVAVALAIPDASRLQQ